jgi:DNA primase
MNKIEKIKSIVSIVDLANSYGAQVYGSGNVKSTKHNPIRSEKTSSLKLYVDTNTFNDFGGVGGDCIDFVSIAENIDVFNAIQTLERLYNIDTSDTYTPTPRPVTVIEKDYIKPEKILNAFNVLFEKINKENHSCLDSIIPSYLLKECEDEDKIEFFNIVSRNLVYCLTKIRT